METILKTDGFRDDPPSQHLCGGVTKHGRVGGISRSYPGGFAIRISPRSSVSPGLTVNSLRMGRRPGSRGVVVSIDAIGCPGDQSGEYNPSPGIGHRRSSVASGVEAPRVDRTGGRRSAFSCLESNSRSGGHDDPDTGPRDLSTGFPPGPTRRAFAVPQRSRRTVTGPPDADLPESWAVAPSSCRESRKKTGTSDSGSRPWSSNWPSRTRPRYRHHQILHPPVAWCPQDDPADDLGVLDRPVIRPDDSDLDGRAPPDHHIDLLPGALGLQVEKGVGVRVEPPAAEVEPRPSDPSAPISRST